MNLSSPIFASILGMSLALLVMTLPQVTFADDAEPSARSTDDDAIDGAIEQADRAHDAALMDTDIEAGTALAEPMELRDDQAHRDLDKENMDRLRAFFDQFDDEQSEPPAALTKLREVSNHFSGSNSAYLTLRPHIADPRWVEAMELLVGNDCEDALELAADILGPAELHVDGDPAISYAFARMQMCGGERTQGRQTMNELAELDSSIGHLARRALGRASSPEVDDNSRGLTAHINVWQQVARDGDVDDALEGLVALRETLDGGWDRHRVRLAEARIMEDAGRIDEAAMAYRGVYRKTRAWRSSDNIASTIESAEKRLDREIIVFDDRIERMSALIARGRYRHAQRVSRENAALRGVSGAEIRGWTRFRQALQRERDRNRPRAVSQFEEANGLIEDDAVRPHMYFGWARALRRNDASDEAIELYVRLCEEYPTHSLCDYASYEAGRLLQYQNQHDEARAHFADVVGLHPFSEYVPDALWRYALSAYLEDDFEKAIPPLTQIVEHYGDIQDVSELTIGLKATYWIGVNHLKLGNDDQAQQWLQRAIDQGALTWYGRLAATRLEDAGMSATVRLPTAQLTKHEIENFSSLRIPDNPRLTVAAELTRLGLYEDALAEVRSQLSVHPKPEGAIQLRAALHLAREEANWAHWIMKSVIDEKGPTHRTLRDWGFAFPLNYFDLSHRYAEEYGVSPFLVHAIMRQESGFRPRVSSHAGAMGLMQLMPGTARYTARTFFENERLTNAKILDPETNVRLGSMYIRIHIAHAKDHPSLALSGYNGGPASLRSWFERYGDRELDAWVESITFRETRGYVRKVMTSYITYQGLYGDGDLPEIDLQLPDELRRWGTVPEVEELEEGEPVSMLID